MRTERAPAVRANDRKLKLLANSDWFIIETAETLPTRNNPRTEIDSPNLQKDRTDNELPTCM
jgi:hypothetical protein